jgi:hypothetical protein
MLRPSLFSPATGWPAVWACRAGHPSQPAWAADQAVSLMAMAAPAGAVPVVGAAVISSMPLVHREPANLEPAVQVLARLGRLGSGALEPIG